MKVERSRAHMEELLERADVRIDGDRPWDIRVSDPRVFARVLAGGSLALGDSYMDGWWECEAMDALFDRFLSAALDRAARTPVGALREAALYRILNPQRSSRAFEIGRRHYDLGNDLFQAMLDRRMIYSCALWDAAATLDAAQEAKLDLLCRKLRLEPGMRVLDTGCGWGGLARYAAEVHRTEVTGITVSERQAETARAVCAGLPVDIRLQDYREVHGRYDRVVSVGMLEHVGVHNYRTYMQAVHRCLPEGGLFVLQTIAGNRSVRSLDPWVRTHIFPNSMLPSARQIAEAAEGLFVLEDWQSLGPHYDRTLMAWYANFVAAWERLRPAYGDRFYRMWRYYLLSSAGAFRARSNQLWQIVFSKGGLRGGYRPAVGALPPEKGDGVTACSEIASCTVPHPIPAPLSARGRRVIGDNSDIPE